jgi:ankyrin repeat protein
MNEFNGDRLPTFFGFAPGSPGRASVEDNRLIVASLPVAERRTQQHLSMHIQDATRRQQEHAAALSKPDNKLIKLCRTKQWAAVYARLSTHPQEALPESREKNSYSNMEVDTESFIKRERLTQKTLRGDDLNLSPESLSIYDVTALGLVCAATWVDTDMMAALVEKLLIISPEQVQCSQRLQGHTPLRDAVRNPSCTPKVLALLLEADTNLPGKMCQKAAYIQDRDCFEPMDHLIFGIHATNSPHSLDLLKLFMNVVGSVGKRSHGEQCTCVISVSPLVRLLSLGTSFGLKQTQDASVSKESPRLGRLLECARCLIEGDPSIVHTRSRSTQCTALHVALRNYGDFCSIIQLLLEADGENFMIQQRNLYGDLPLHVASSVGVPMSVLRLVLEKTVHAVEKINDLPHQLVWSTNISGFTAADLEWMRHIEGGRGFQETRAFYPLETSGIRWHCSRQDEFYRDLLRDAVAQVIVTKSSDNTVGRQERAAEPFGRLLDRIMLLIHVAHRGAVMPPSHDLTFNLLHAASSLARASGPCLPKPLLDLIYWIDESAVIRADAEGRLPIHYSVMPSTTCDDVALKSTRKDQIEATDYLSWVKFLLDEAPATSRMADKQLRLPLHYALDGSFTGADAWGRIRTDDEAPEMETPSWQQEVIAHLVYAFPDSVERKDPQTCLFPFMQAASNPNVSLDVVFSLLRRSPALLNGCMKESIADVVMS